MKKVLILFVFAFVFAYNFAQNPVKAKVKTPAIYFEETARDFGTVTEGTSS
ncbi:MAG: hypothetical protein H8E61_00265, partial [Bacteroidetes bacterium]|nr:hypothetical protein [Bacteroidota bacterium]